MVLASERSFDCGAVHHYDDDMGLGSYESTSQQSMHSFLASLNRSLEIFVAVMRLLLLNML